MDDAEQTWPQLDTLIQAYLNQDMDLWADSPLGAVEIYMADASQEERANLLGEIARFSDAHAGKLDDEFRERYGFDFHPEEIGMSVAGFFDHLRHSAERRQI